MNKFSKYNWFVADEGDNMFNIFSYHDFDDNGYYVGHAGEDGYHISDFDIVYKSVRFRDAERWIDNH